MGKLPTSSSHHAPATPMMTPPVLPMAQPSAQVIQAAAVADLHLSAAAVADTVAYPGSGKLDASTTTTTTTTTLQHTEVVTLTLLQHTDAASAEPAAKPAAGPAAAEPSAAAEPFSTKGNLCGVLACGAWWIAVANQGPAACNYIRNTPHVRLPKPALQH